MNRLTLAGRLTADPELRYSTEGTAFCSMRIAVNGVGDDEAMFLDLTTFGKEAEACSQHLHKGRRIGFDGRMQNRSWTDRRRHQAQQVQRRGSRRVSRQRATRRCGRRAGDNACCRHRSGRRAGGRTTGGLNSGPRAPGASGCRAAPRPCGATSTGRWTGRRFASTSVTAAARHDSARDSF
jgi:single stranded DNA-binding protein